MVLPNLLHPVTVTVSQIDRAATIQDPDAREPLQHAARLASWTIQAQVKYEPQPGGPGASDSLKTLPQGPSTEVQGYALFRYYDLANHATGPKVIQKGDRITTTGHLAGEYYITRLQPRGHYTDQNGATLLKAWFTDRNPAKES